MALALGVVKDIVKTGMAIMEAVKTVHQNEKECQDLLELVAPVFAILSRLQEMGLTSHPSMSAAALRGIRGSLDGALELVTKCQKRNVMYSVLTAGKMAKQLRRVHDDIQMKMQLLNLTITASMMEITIELTRTTIVRHDGAHPLPTQSQRVRTTSRTFVKVYKLGSLGRSLDITRFSSYYELRSELERSFGLEGQLEDPVRSGWQLVFADRENDILLVGDDPWQEFVNSVWYIKIKILSPQDVQQMVRDGDGLLSAAGARMLQSNVCDDYSANHEMQNLTGNIATLHL